MKASLFCTASYMGAAPYDIWPASGEYYSGDAAVRSIQTTFGQFRCADNFGFDRVTSRRAPLFGFLAHTKADGHGGRAESDCASLSACRPPVDAAELHPLDAHSDFSERIKSGLILRCARRLSPGFAGDGA
jgi:hypothetical protein